MLMPVPLGRCNPVVGLEGLGGDAYDNAVCERFFGSIECELIERTSLRSFTHARREAFEYLEGWYNPHRRLSALGYQSPITYERSHERAA